MRSEPGWSGMDTEAAATIATIAPTAPTAPTALDAPTGRGSR
jgi:hypothetical protein